MSKEYFGFVTFECDDQTTICNTVTLHQILDHLKKQDLYFVDLSEIKEFNENTITDHLALVGKYLKEKAPFTFNTSSIIGSYEIYSNFKTLFNKNELDKDYYLLKTYLEKECKVDISNLCDYDKHPVTVKFEIYSHDSAKKQLSRTNTILSSKSDAIDCDEITDFLYTTENLLKTGTVPLFECFDYEWIREHYKQFINYITNVHELMDSTWSKRELNIYCHEIKNLKLFLDNKVFIKEKLDNLKFEFLHHRKVYFELDAIVEKILNEFHIN